MHLLLTRPDPGPDADPLALALIAAGHRITHAPLLTVHTVGKLPSLAGVQGFIATSRNGLKAVAPLPEHAQSLPLLAVGPGTGELGRELGFRQVIEGPGTGRELAEIIRETIDPGAGALVHLAAETLAFDLKGALAGDGFEVRTEVVYRTDPVSTLPADATTALRDHRIDGVVLMSPRTARVYAKLAADGGLVAETRKVVHFCLSDAVARELCPLGTVKTVVARLPNSQEMLALIAREASDSV
ncbi:uroporphyrinogen-III synthase [Hyphomicrobium sp.]|uniref:uroporphyrinogen-III synthase n=1 Tax=Hyphomicrobium sp. TaxID=82 RepID=UPI002E2FC782|nr:uroporphyrinogen-III synthase [Hyphomicrobium sp.]HEX2840784.1 uroporphyrinogen-III synthase [Hyphomicrobium sp.]